MRLPVNGSYNQLQNPPKAYACAVCLSVCCPSVCPSVSLGCADDWHHTTTPSNMEQGTVGHLDCLCFVIEEREGFAADTDRKMPQLPSACPPLTFWFLEQRVRAAFADYDSNLSYAPSWCPVSSEKAVPLRSLPSVPGTDSSATEAMLYVCVRIL